MPTKYNQEYYKRYSKKQRTYIEKYLAKNPHYRLYYSAKQRALRSRIEFTISPEDVKIPKQCPYLLISLTTTRGKGLLPSNASIDRIDSTKGYTPDNIQVISHLANRMKQNATQLELLQFARSVIKMHNISKIAAAVKRHENGSEPLQDV